MKNQALFTSKDKSKKLKSRLLQFLFGALRVKTNSFGFHDLIPKQQKWYCSKYVPNVNSMYQWDITILKG